MIPIGILTGAATSSFSFLLDDYPGASVAYSLRKLRSAYTGNCVRIRRSSDNTEQDFGFVNNYLDTTALSTFCGAGNGFITIWYEQSGNANNAFQTILISQLQIFFSGSFLIKNSKIYITGTINQYIVFTTAIIKTPAQDYSWWFIYEKDASSNQGVLTNGGGQYLWLDYGMTTQFVNNSQAISISPFNYAINTQYLVNHYSVSPSVSIYANNVLRATLATQTANNGLNQILLQGFHSKITLTEFVYYPVSQLSNRTAITNNINSYYTIY
jgi:hypothetical protein